MAKKKASGVKKVTLKKKPVESEPKVVVKAEFSKDRVMTENSNDARLLYDQSRFGTTLASGRVRLAIIEALYLMEKGRLEVYKTKTKTATFDELTKKARRLESNFSAKYAVYRDIRNRGYIIKTALKFGADFRIYDRGVKPGEDHARWVVFPVDEGQSLTWHEFAAKNRVAHSTRKRLLIGVVDAEDDVSYWEVRWMRP